MNAMIRGLKGLLALAALTAVGLGLRWATAGSIEAATTQDLTSMAVLTVGAVAWVAYVWLLAAVLATVLEQTPGVIGRGASQVAARITSQTSRALLRSALGVAAVTPLTIGVAHAAPTDTSHPDWAPLEPASSLRLAAPTDWRATEKPSSVPLTDEPRLTAHPDQHFRALRTTDAQDHRTAVPTEAAQPRTSDTTGDWRAVEKASSVQLTGEAHPSEPNQRPVQPKAGRVGAPDRPVQPVRPKAGRVGVPDRPVQPVRPKAGRVGVPDRPTVGAPTRYTDLRSGHPVRPATRVVQYGDTLWDLAAAELGPDATDAAVAARWPQWYAANRALIGPDPDQLYPGQVLRIPAAGHPVPPTHQEK
ncbi:LysM peptidoglycan-binding domain-containing protein [Kribbella monticola]|uniref:LysM peptidoglycan-binding domain-containing protein n=1 Tax=Kribbella monticola TaxID=2185285 RepID=UPI0018E4F029|nr:LysM peptidoglycan-binding domain-containing protein [Kribbella monticola]